MSFHCGLTDCRCQCPLLVKSCPVPVKQLKPNQNYHQSPWAPLCLFDPLRARRDAQSSHHAEGRVGRQRAKPLLILVGDFAGCFFYNHGLHSCHLHFPGIIERYIYISTYTYIYHVYYIYRHGVFTIKHGGRTIGPGKNEILQANLMIN